MKTGTTVITELDKLRATVSPLVFASIWNAAIEECAKICDLQIGQSAGLAAEAIRRCERCAICCQPISNPDAAVRLSKRYSAHNANVRAEDRGPFHAHCLTDMPLIHEGEAPADGSGTKLFDAKL